MPSMRQWVVGAYKLWGWVVKVWLFVSAKLLPNEARSQRGLS